MNDAEDIKPAEVPEIELPADLAPVEPVAPIIPEADDSPVIVCDSQDDVRLFFVPQSETRIYLTPGLPFHKFGFDIGMIINIDTAFVGSWRMEGNFRLQFFKQGTKLTEIPLSFIASNFGPDRLSSVGSPDRAKIILGSRTSGYAITDQTPGFPLGYIESLKNEPNELAGNFASDFYTEFYPLKKLLDSGVYNLVDGTILQQSSPIKRRFYEFWFDGDELRFVFDNARVDASPGTAKNGTLALAYLDFILVSLQGRAESLFNAAFD